VAKKETAQAPAKKKAKQEAAPFTEPARLRLKYKEIIPQLVEKFGYENPMQVPKLEKIVLNMGLGSDKDNPKGIDAAVDSASSPVRSPSSPRLRSPLQTSKSVRA